MYICDNGHSFDEPVAPCVHNMSPYYYEACPECGATDIYDAHKCSGCGESTNVECWTEGSMCAGCNTFHPAAEYEVCPCGSEEIGPGRRCPNCGWVEVYQ